MTTLTVGVGQQYARIADAVAASHDGDVVQVQAGTYTNDFSTINTKITIQGVNGMAHLVATAPPPDGKSIMTVNTDLTIDHLEFSGAQVSDNNGAGIRYQGGNLTITNSYFHDNQEGLLGTPATAGTGTITIKTSEFAHNGAGDGYSHNIYVNDLASLSIDSSYFHDAVVGHEIKSRAEQTTITNTRIVDGPNGTASYSIDLPNGGAALLQNDVIEQGPKSQNPIVIAYGEEGNLRANSSLTVTGDTILNDLASGSALGIWNQSGLTAKITGNSVYGLSASQMLRGPGTVTTTTMLGTEPKLVTTSPMLAAPAPTPTPTPTPAPTPAPKPTGTIVLHLSEDAYQGDAQFIATVDGKQLGPAQSVTALHSQGQSQAFAFSGSFAAGAHTVGVTFLNDAWGGTSSTDRNLWVDSIDINGTSNPSATAALFSNGTKTFSVATAAAAPAPAPAPIDTIVLKLSEDAYQGDAQFIASVDGKQLGPAQSVTALYRQGQTEAFTFNGNFSVGAHDLAISFLNDAWGGSDSTDRNLFVNAVQLDGMNSPAATAALFSNGTVHFAVTIPAHG